MNIHSFSLNGMHILLDVNSGAVHVVDEMISDIMNVFDGGNDEAVLASLAEQYSEDELREALAELQTMPWSGNIRELRNVIERLIILSEERITPADVKAYC